MRLARNEKDQDAPGAAEDTQESQLHACAAVRAAYPAGTPRRSRNGTSLALRDLAPPTVLGRWQRQRQRSERSAPSRSKAAPTRVSRRKAASMDFPRLQEAAPPRGKTSID